MRPLQVAPSVRTYNTLMAVCARAGDRRGMLRYFALIGEGGMRATVAAGWLDAHGFDHLDVYLGSMGAWKAAS